MFSFFWGILVCLPVLQAGQTLLEIPENVASPETVLTERVITDEAAVENGVVIDYRYNDTTTDTRRSAPGCPQNEGGYPWLYYSVSGAETDTKCFLSGVQGPCEYDHIFVPNADTNFGFCNCHCFEKNEWDNFQVDDNQQKPDKLCKSFNDGQLRVFVTRLNKCFTVYEQGFCSNQQEWLAATPVDRPNGWQGPRIWSGRAFCEKRKCEPDRIPHYNGPADNNKNFTCGIPFSAQSGVALVGPADCEERGERYSTLLKKCLKKAAQSSVVG